MPPYAGTIVIAITGIAALTGMTFGATPQTRQIAAILPPWHNGALARAASTGLAILDLHWDNRVILLETGGDPTALSRLRAQGFWLLDATGTTLCTTLAEGP